MHLLLPALPILQPLCLLNSHPFAEDRVREANLASRSEEEGQARRVEVVGSVADKVCVEGDNKRGETARFSA